MSEEGDREVALRYIEQVQSLLDDPRQTGINDLQTAAALALKHAGAGLALFEKSSKFSRPTSRAYAYRQEGMNELDLCAKYLNEAFTYRK